MNFPRLVWLFAQGLRVFPLKVAVIISSLLFACAEHSDRGDLAGHAVATLGESSCANAFPSASFSEPGSVLNFWSGQTYSNANCYKGSVVESYNQGVSSPSLGTVVTWADSIPADRPSCESLWLASYVYAVVNGAWTKTLLKQANGTWIREHCVPPTVLWSPAEVPAGGPYKFITSARPAATNSAPTRKYRIYSELGQCVQQDPRAAVPLDPTVQSDFAVAASPLYQGTNASQKPVGPGVLDPSRVAVIQGKVLGANGTPAACVPISVVGAPEYGRTSTFADGTFAIAVNGGASVTVQAQLADHVTVQRLVTTMPNRFAFVQDIHLIPYGPATSINTSATTTVLGATETDVRGTRQAVMFVPPGAQPTIVGTGAHPSPYSVSMTESTNVDKYGQDGMPATLPPLSAFTYLVNLNVQGYEDQDVSFNKPIPVYVDNFLGFPVGTPVPVGRYDRGAKQWVSEDNGVILKIVGVNAAGEAQIDFIPNAGDSTTGADSPTLLTTNPALQPSAADLSSELKSLYTKYGIGKTLWRFPTNHFSPWDCNWGFSPPPDAEPPNQPPPTPDAPPCTASGSIIDCDSQVLREEIPIAGTPFNLSYSSARQPGSARRINIPITGDTLPARDLMTRVLIEVDVGGVRHKDEIVPQTNYSYDFVWDGRDAAGRLLSGPQAISVAIGYEYRSTYAYASRFGYNGNGYLITLEQLGNPSLTLWQRRLSSTRAGFGSGATIGAVNAYSDLGGWTLSAHHSYSPLTGVLSRGDGTTETVTASELVTIAGSGVAGHLNNPSLLARMNIHTTSGIAVSKSGDVFFSDSYNNVIRRISNGNVSDLTAPVFVFPSGLVFGPDGQLYVIDDDKVYRIDPNSGAVSTYIGSGLELATGPLAFGPDGNLYVADVNHIWRFRAGSLEVVVSNPPASPRGLAFDAAGSLYYTADDGRLLRFGPDSVTTVIAGGVPCPPRFGNGGPASQACLSSPAGLAIGPDGLLYIADVGHYQIRRLDPDGTIQPVAGTGVSADPVEHVPATLSPLRECALGLSHGMPAFGPDSTLFLGDCGTHRIRTVALRSGACAGCGPGFVLTSRDGDESYQFDSTGRHIATVDAHTGATIYSFAYTSQGSLSSINDGAGRSTLVERDPGTQRALAIVSPDKQRTSLTIDTTGDRALRVVTRPDQGSYTFDYDPGLLLTKMTDPKSNDAGGIGSYSFSYTDGSLTRDQDPRQGGPAQTLTRTAGGSHVTVVRSTPMGNAVSYTTDTKDGRHTRTVKRVSRTQTAADETAAVESRTADGVPTIVGPDGQAYDSVLNQADGTKIYSLRSISPGSGSLYSARRLTVLPTSQTQKLVQGAQTTSISSTTGIITGETKTTTVNNHPSSTAVFDAATRTFTETSAAGRKSYRTLDASGRVASLRVDPFNPTTFTYDTTTGRLSSTTQAQRIESYGYFPADPNGNKAGYLSGVTVGANLSPPVPATTTIGFDRDFVGWPVSEGIGVTNPLTTGLGWDKNGNLASVTPPGASTHLLQSSLINQLSKYTPPGGNDTNYTYNGDRALDLITLPDSSTIQYTYDSVGRKDTVTFPGGLLNYDYYAGNASPTAGAAPGRMSALSGPYTVNLAFQYDGFLPTNVTWSGGVVGSVGWTYDSDFSPMSETVTPATGAASTTYVGYDHDKLVTCVSVSSCTSSPLPSDALQISRSASRVETVTLGSIQEVRTPNAYGELASQVVTFAPSTPLMSITYDDGGTHKRDPNGRIVRKNESFNGQTAVAYDYLYDFAGRLTDVKRNGITVEHYAYDANGNRISRETDNHQTIFYDSQDRITTYEGATYTYQTGGELRSRSYNGQLWTFTYDALGNLVTASSPSKRIDYLVDGLGRRVGKKVGGVITRRWLYRDGLSPVAELDGSGNLVARFVYGSRRNVPDYVIRGGNTYRLISDQLGSIRIVVNIANSSDVPYRADYSAFGSPTFTLAPGITSDWIPFGFAGGLYEADTGLVRFGARDYDVISGRWTAKDPMLFLGQQANIYMYLGNDPINALDRTGLGPGWGGFAKANAWEATKQALGPIGNIISFIEICIQHPKECGVVATVASRCSAYAGAGLLAYALVSGESGDLPPEGAACKAPADDCVPDGPPTPPPPAHCQNSSAIDCL